MDEAQRIITLNQLGYSRGEIQNKMTFKSKKATAYSVNTVIDKYLDGDLPIENVAVSDMDIEDDLTVEYRVQKLEERVKILEEKLNAPCVDGVESNKNIVERIRTWI